MLQFFTQPTCSHLTLAGKCLAR